MMENTTNERDMQSDTNKHRLIDIEKHIIDRTSEQLDISAKRLIEISIHMKQLNSHIKGDIELSKNRIKSVLKNLVSNFSLNLIYELNENIVLRRARKFEEETSVVDNCFDELKDLIAISEEEKSKAKVGRLNKAEHPIYYAVISDKHYNNFDVSLSEIEANETDCINSLDSVTIKSLNAVYIGAFDIIIKGDKLPEWVNEFYIEAFRMFKDRCKTNKYLFESYILCSAFFSDILKRKGSSKLYEVTSTLSHLLLDDENVDAIVYESVQVRGAPVIAIKPSAVAKKVKHETVISFKVLSSLGYGLFYGKEINKGKVKEGQLVWSN